MRLTKHTAIVFVCIVCFAACKDNSDTTTLSSLHPAFSEFNQESTEIYLDGDQVVIESNGLPNHTSPYWEESHALHIDQVVGDHTTPGFITERNYTLTVSISPQKASSSSATSLGAIGIAVSGVPIFNDEEGPNRPFDVQTATGLDYAGAHNGPSGYHYHLEAANVPENTSLSYDDEKLIGIISDGFFLYGRRQPDGTYPTDLDASGGEFGPTIHNPDGEYHYHVINEVFGNSYYLLFPGDYQGTPNGIQ